MRVRAWWSGSNFIGRALRGVKLAMLAKASLRGESFLRRLAFVCGDGRALGPGFGYVEGYECVIGCRYPLGRKPAFEAQEGRFEVAETQGCEEERKPKDSKGNDEGKAVHDVVVVCEIL